MEQVAFLGTSPAPATQSPGASRERSAGDRQVAGRVRVQDSIEGLKHLNLEKTEGNPRPIVLSCNCEVDLGFAHFTHVWNKIGMTPFERYELVA
jgi:hypothetical protein